MHEQSSNHGMSLWYVHLMTGPHQLYGQRHNFSLKLVFISFEHHFTGTLEGIIIKCNNFNYIST